MQTINVQDGQSQRKPLDQRKPRARDSESEWVPNTDLGILVKLGKITMEEICYFSMKPKEVEIIDFLFRDTLKEEVVGIKSIQKQTSAGQRTLMKVTAVVGNEDGYVGIGVKSAKEAASAIRGAIAKAKLALRPVALGYWGKEVGKSHTVPVKGTGKCGSVTLRVVPAPKGTGIVAGQVPKKIFQLAGIKDVFTASRGKTKTTSNFAKAAIIALSNSSSFYTPSMWEQSEEKMNPLIKNHKAIKDFKEKLVKK